MPRTKRGAGIRRARRSSRRLQRAGGVRCPEALWQRIPTAAACDSADVALTWQRRQARAWWRGSLALSIGIAQGQVLCGTELFPLSGRPTHEAHVLAAQAQDGEVLISEDIRRSLGESVQTQRAAAALHPHSEPVTAWSLHTIGNVSDAASRPFVGRRPELAMILASLERCMTSRHGRAIVVRGEAGIGKTRLVDAVRSAAVERGVGVHSAQIFDFGQSPGRRPITTLALSLLGIRSDAAASERKAAVQRMASARGGSFDQIIFVSDLIDAPLDAELAALEKAMEVATRQRGRTLALAQIIEAAAQRSPQLLVVEDVHWADSDELARLGEIAAVVANCQILFIMTTRPEGDPFSATWRARARGCPLTTVDLAPLAEDEAQELAAHYPELSCETIQACIVRAEGYPLFLDQLLRSASSGQSTLPGSVRSLVLSRADSLSAQDHLALEAAAVLGQRAELAIVRRMLGDEGYEPEKLLATTLVRSDGVEMEFAHALFRDAIYESTLKSQRRALHRIAADWFATRDLSLHADHLAAADDEHASAAYIKAAEAERSALRFENGLMLANKASALAREPIMLHKTSMLAGRTAAALGRTHDALSAYREALDFALDQHRPRRCLVRHRLGAARDGPARGSPGGAGARRKHVWRDAADAQMRARMSTLHGNLCFPLGSFRCLPAPSHQKAYQFAQEANSPPEIARALGGLGDAHYQRGNMLTARFFKLAKRKIEAAAEQVIRSARPPASQHLFHHACSATGAKPALPGGGQLTLPAARPRPRTLPPLRSTGQTLALNSPGILLGGFTTLSEKSQRALMTSIPHSDYIRRGLRGGHARTINSSHKLRGIIGGDKMIAQEVTHTTPEPMQISSEAFAEKLLGMLNGAALALMISIGHRTGLFDAMAGLPPVDVASRSPAAPGSTSATCASGSARWSPAASSSTTPATRHLPPAAGARGVPDPRGRARTTSPSPCSGSRCWARSRTTSSSASATAAACRTAAYPRFHEVMAEESAQTVVAALLESHPAARARPARAAAGGHRRARRRLRPRPRAQPAWPRASPTAGSPATTSPTRRSPRHARRPSGRGLTNAPLRGRRTWRELGRARRVRPDHRLRRHPRPGPARARCCGTSRRRCGRAACS